MRTQSLKSFVAVFVLALAALFSTAVSAQAQQTLNFEVSFDFYVGKQKMEAGRYRMSRLNYGRYVLENAETKDTAIVVFTVSESQPAPADVEKVIFNRYGETNFFRGFAARRGKMSHEAPVTNFEKQVRRDAGEEERLADKQARPKQVSVTLSNR